MTNPAVKYKGREPSISVNGGVLHVGPDGMATHLATPAGDVTDLPPVTVKSLQGNPRWFEFPVKKAPEPKADAPASETPAEAPEPKAKHADEPAETHAPAPKAVHKSTPAPKR